MIAAAWSSSWQGVVFPFFWARIQDHKDCIVLFCWNPFSMLFPLFLFGLLWHIQSSGQNAIEKEWDTNRNSPKWSFFLFLWGFFPHVGASWRENLFSIHLWALSKPAPLGVFSPLFPALMLTFRPVWKQLTAHSVLFGATFFRVTDMKYQCQFLCLQAHFPERTAAPKPCGCLVVPLSSHRALVSSHAGNTLLK